MPKGVKDRAGRAEAKKIAQIVAHYVMKAYQLGCLDGIDILHERLAAGRQEQRREMVAQTDLALPTTGEANGGKVVHLRKRRVAKRTQPD